MPPLPKDTLPLLAPPEIALKLARGTVVAGKYRLEKGLSHGAMGSVWVATHLALETPVAIKFMSAAILEEPDGTPTAQGTHMRARFEREAKAAAQIRAANVVQILDYGVDQGAPYIVMELLQGEDLGARLARGRLPLAEVAVIVSAIARALERAHTAGLVHRDLKPANVFLAKEGEEEVPKILDFGVAKATQGGPSVSGERTLEGALVGTPSYMSPEQTMGIDIDHRSDLWSLGVIAYRAITGVKPFPAEALFEAIVQIRTDDVPKASTLVPGLPPAVDDFFARALERDAAKRFQSAKELAKTLAAAAPAPATSAPEVPAPRASVEASAEASVEDVALTGDGPTEVSHTAGAGSTSQSVLPIAPSVGSGRRRLVWVAAAIAVVGVGAGTLLSLLARDGGWRQASPVAAESPATLAATPPPPLPSDEPAPGAQPSPPPPTTAPAPVASVPAPPATVSAAPPAPSTTAAPPLPAPSPPATSTTPPTASDEPAPPPRPAPTMKTKPPSPPKPKHDLGY